MPPIKLRNRMQASTTTISNNFIDRYMVEANGEYVKIYLYVLRLSQDPDETWTMTTIAEKLDCTTLDVKRALSYWSKRGLLNCGYNEDQQLIAVEFLDPEAVGEESPADPARDEALMTPSRINALKGDAQVRQIIMVAENYLQHPLSCAEIETFLYFYDKLNFSADLLDYLIEYCVSKGGCSLAYIKKVGLAWADEGITTVEQAKEASSSHDKEYYKIMRAYGLSGRRPSNAEREYIRVWLKNYQMPLDVVLTAVDRTMLQAHGPSFKYTDSILRSWKESGVTSIDDIRTLDAEHAAKVTAQTAAKQAQGAKQTQAAPGVKATRFSNFTDHDYDYDRLFGQTSAAAE